MSNGKVDYKDRTVDLLMLKTVLEVPAVNKRVSVDVEETPMIVSGVEKMVQRYATSFINAMGSAKFRPDRGTNLIPAAGKGQIYDMDTLTAVAAEADLMARTQVMDGDEDEDTPDDERLVESEVYDLKFSRGEGRAKVSVRLTTAAGESYEYIIPVAVGVR